MIFEKEKVIFLHYPKTGGNSVQYALQNYTDDKLVISNEKQDGKERFEVRSNKYPMLKKHSKLNDYHKMLGDDFLNFQVFITIRNPFDRLVSFYFSPIRGKVEYRRDDFAHFLRGCPKLESYIWYQKASSSQPEIFENIKYMKFEQLDIEILKLCKPLKIRDIKLPKLNASKRDNYRKYYDDELKNWVYREHKFEIALGRYTF